MSGPTLRRLMRFGLAGLLALLQGMAIADAHNAEVAAVRALYARFAAEAVLDDTPATGMMDAAPSVLRQHLDDDLVRLWLRDRDCARRTREICRLDFAPIWDSQDPVGTSVRVNWDEDKRRVVATLRTADGKPRQLAYSLARRRDGWRVADIDFGPGRPSLKQLLSAGPP